LDDGGLDDGLLCGLIGRDFFKFCFQLRVRIKYKSNQIFIGSAGPAGLLVDIDPAGKHQIFIYVHI
jgi:hypothetical protein